MPEKRNTKIVSKADLGGGKKQLTLQINAEHESEYMQMFRDAGAEITTSEGIKIGKGSVKNRYAPSGGDLYSGFTSNDTPYTYAFNAIPSDPHDKMKFAMELYKLEPVVGTVIDLMVDFSASGFTNECEDQEVKKLYDSWAKEVRLSELIEGIFLEFYRSGNVTIYRSDKNATVKKTTTTKNKKTSKEYKFPAGYTVLSPLNVFIEGLMMFNLEMVTLQLPKEVIRLIKDNKTPEYIINQLPEEFVRIVRAGGEKVPLNPELVSRITRRKQDYERYASPFLERVFEPVLYKRKLRQMDMATIEGLINQLVTVTVGNDEYPATDDDLEAIAELFNTPNKAYTVFWNHTLQVTFHTPEGLDSLHQDKYKQVNEDIMTGIGVSRVLLDGQGANFSTAWVSILSLIERLENAREKVKDWIEKEYRRIAEENNFKIAPTIRFNNMNLREDTYVRDVLLAMYDRGLLDAEDLLVETGRDYRAIVETKKRNKKNSSLFEPPMPANQNGGNGRPTGTGGNYPSNRKTSPTQNDGKAPKPKSSKATASSTRLEEEYESELSEIYRSIQADISGLVEANKNIDDQILEGMIMATVLAMFKSLQSVGASYIGRAIETEFDDYEVSGDMVDRLRRELIQWNNSYLNKLAHDIKDKIVSSIRRGLEPDEAVLHAFSTNHYRISLIASSGIVESVRQAKIEGNKATGSRFAQWVAHLDDRTCATCSGLDGQEFPIDAVPPRPHAHCRCDLTFN